MLPGESANDTPTDNLGTKKKGPNYDGFTYARSEFSLKMSGEVI